MQLALFDFDGTITYGDSFIPFLRLAAGRARTVAALAALAPLIAGYRSGWVGGSLMRQAVALAVLSGCSEERIRKLGSRFHLETLRRSVRPQAEQRLSWHLANGHEVYVVSASLDFYLEPWCKERGIGLICNRIQTRAGRLTGFYEGTDCCGPEKAKRVQQRLALHRFSKIYAYGDTADDDELLALAQERSRQWKA